MLQPARFVGPGKLPLGITSQLSFSFNFNLRLDALVPTRRTIMIRHVTCHPPRGDLPCALENKEQRTKEREDWNREQ